MEGELELYALTSKIILLKLNSMELVFKTQVILECGSLMVFLHLFFIVDGKGMLLVGFILGRCFMEIQEDVDS